ncbi:MAG TPA: RDD family protein, partial [Bdellovibrionales bacterium]|nr:RDD family protein [Bdellovibrionales bacterium]
FFAVCASVMAGVLSFIVYQTAFVFLTGATPGKKAFGLKIESIWGADVKLTAMSAFLRAIVMCLEALCLGFPWLAIYGNDRRRPFHDRIADTVVVAGPRRRRIGPPTLQEISFASGCIAAVLTVFSLVLTYQILLYQRGVTGAKLMSELEENGNLCKAVGEAELDWIPEAKGKSPSRLAVAVSLFEAGIVDETCLKLEADFSLWRPGDKSLSYLARALSEENDPQMAETYFEKVCQENGKSDACIASRLLREPESKTEDAVEDEEKTEVAHRETEIEKALKAIGPNSEPFLKVIAIQNLRDSGRNSEALAMLDRFPPQRALGGFVSMERAKIMWALERYADSHLVMRTAIDGLSPTDRVDLSRWFCSNETWRMGCSQEAKESCDLLAAAVETDEELLREPPIAAAYVRGVACEDGKTDFEQAEKRLIGEDSKKFMQALKHLVTNRRREAIELLRGLAGSTGEESGIFAAEATAKLIAIADSIEELTWARMRWSDLDSDAEAWQMLGRQLIKRYNTMKKWDESIEVGLKLKDANAIDRETARDMVIASYRGGYPAMALHYIDQAQIRKTNSEVSRAPASTVVDEFDEVVGLLQASPETRKRR